MAWPKPRNRRSPVPVETSSNGGGGAPGGAKPHAVTPDQADRPSWPSPERWPSAHATVAPVPVEAQPSAEEPGIRADRSGRPAVLGELGAGRRSGRPRRARRRLPGGRARGRRGHGRRPAAPAILGTRGRHRGRDPRTAEGRGHRPAPGQRGAPVGEPADAGLAAAGHRRGHRRVAVRLPAERLALGADLRRAGRHRRHRHPVADGVQGPGGRPADQGPEAHRCGSCPAWSARATGPCTSCPSRTARSRSTTW